MKFAWVEGVPVGTGIVTGLNRKGSGEEKTGHCTPQDLLWGMDAEMYTVVNGDLRAIDGVSRDLILVARDAEKNKQEAIKAIDEAFEEAEAKPVPVGINGVTYTFEGGYQSSLMIDNARTLADNLNENDVELWDYYGQPHIFSKADANTIAIVIGLSFRNKYSAMKHAKKDLG